MQSAGRRNRRPGRRCPSLIHPQDYPAVRSSGRACQPIVRPGAERSSPARCQGHARPATGPRRVPCAQGLSTTHPALARVRLILISRQSACYNQKYHGMRLYRLGTPGCRRCCLTRPRGARIRGNCICHSGIKGLGRSMSRTTTNEPPCSARSPAPSIRVEAPGVAPQRQSSSWSQAADVIPHSLGGQLPVKSASTPAASGGLSFAARLLRGVASASCAPR
jgi:hypothetical protein